ncbi:MAG: hypothetical protein Q4D97_02670 [Eubacteriales bacterium]|nr:hypothetical protein [Eubacteriales bacterium]
MKKKSFIWALSLALVMALCMPRALALENTPQNLLVCENEEHTHNEYCYSLTNSLICELEEVEGLHQHEASCYKEEVITTCGLAEHRHGEECFEPVSEPELEPSLFERLMACNSPEELQAMLEIIPDEELTSLTAEEQAAIQEKFSEPEPLPPPEAEDRVLICAEDHLHTDACYGTAEQPQPEICLFERLMACETLEELQVMIASTPEEQLASLSEEEQAAIQEKFSEPEPLPSPPVEDRVLICAEDHLHTDACYGTDEQTQQEVSLFERLMACETLEELQVMIASTPEEQLASLSEEEQAAIQEKFSEPEPLPSPPVEDRVLICAEDHLHTDACYGTDEQTQQEVSLFERLMACETVEELHGLIRSTPPEELMDLGKEGKTKILAKFSVTIPTCPPPSIKDSQGKVYYFAKPATSFLGGREADGMPNNEPVCQEIIAPTVNFTNVSPLVDLPEG